VVGFGRKKTDIELAESPQEQADRLRGALFAAHSQTNFKVAKRIMQKAMAGELHGFEPKPLKDELGFNIFSDASVPIGMIKVIHPGGRVEWIHTNFP
jgi:hypothetical protein